ncbi:MAG: class I SAM-dependent methyltransferase [Acidimicrobiales bacterium]|nr:class I SAM-dependent methyltransferase [Acidimicrobiales bacterium]
MTDIAGTHAIDPDALKLFSFQLFTKLEGAVTAGMIHLGDQLGLFAALKQAGEPISTAELAARTHLTERWVREWAYNQAAARMITVTTDGAGERFSLTPEAAAVLATPEHPAYGMGMFHRLPQTMRALEEMPESFRSGVGHDYDSHGPQGAVGIERSFEPWNRANLLPNVLPALDGVVDKLRAGARLVDIGCGAGSAVLLMAGAFPASHFAGYDISKFALGRAAQKLEESGLTNASFHDPRDEPIPSNGSVDVITTFDCIHDMTHPQEMMHTIRRAIHDDGTWLLVDIKALDTFEENAKKNPMASLMYGISVLSCMSSALSEPGGAGLGTLGLSENRARDMAAAAGFSRFRRLDVDHSVNAFYEVRP